MFKPAPGWVYTLRTNYSENFPALRGIFYNPNEYVCVFPTGDISIRFGYSWDGATCTLNTKDLIEPSLIHDALYQCLREGADKSLKKIADLVFYDALLRNGVNKFVAWVMYQAVSNFAPKSSYTPIWRL